MNEEHAQLLASGYLNTLEARAALADLLRPCFIVNNGWVVELSMPHTVMDEFVRRYDALDQGAQEETQ